MEDTPMDVDNKQRQLHQQLLPTRSKPVAAPLHAEIQADNLQWIKLVIDFFELSQSVVAEKESAIKIEEFFCNIRRHRVRKIFLQAYYKHLGFTKALNQMPFDLKLKIASYLSPKDLLVNLSAISKDMLKVSRSPVLWRKISIFAQKDGSSMLHQDNYLLQLIRRSTQL